MVPSSCSHENASGFYRVSVFFFSQIVTDLIAKRIIPVLLFSVITYFMIGFQLEATKFFIFLLTLFMVSITAASVTYSFSSLAKVTTVATLLSALTFVFSMVGPFLLKYKLPSTPSLPLSSLPPLSPAVWRVLHCPQLTACVAALAQVPESVPLRNRSSGH